MLIYTETITPRLRYIADFSGKLISGNAFELTTDRDVFQNASSVKINYSSRRISSNEFWLKPHQLLFETTVTGQHIQCSVIDNRPVFFQTEGDWAFDIFAASFYLLSRYEEYLPHGKDMYGRFAHENSIAFKENFLQQPLVNQWWADLRTVLKDRFKSLNDPLSGFKFLPTYDIDIAWSYKGKGLRRNMGAFMQGAIKGNWKQMRERLSVLRNKAVDPYDSYDWLHQLHEKHLLKPYYFFLVANKKGKYDKNISPGEKALQQLIRDHFNRYPIGIHPSWRSGDEPGLLKEELGQLSGITGSGCLTSRQHYIRFTLPATFRQLIDAGIRYDFSMGYGSINGFRASVATPFYWYDLASETQTGLMLFPFCYMEANSFYEQKYSPDKALQEMRDYRKTVKSVGGTMITIWHNHFLGTEKMFDGWRKAYEQFISETAEKL